METRKDDMWQELIEAKAFNQLSNTEKAFVLSVSSEENYRLERAVIVESKGVYVAEEPRPLILTEKKKAVIIPLYQALIAVAASFVVAFLLFRSSGNSIEIVKNQPLASTDTVYVEKLVIDTVIQTKTKYIQIAAKQSNNDAIQPVSPCESTSSVLSNQGRFDADLSSSTIANKGTSAANDETRVLMESWVGPN